jgi:hypothetical protein
MINLYVRPSFVAFPGDGRSRDDTLLGLCADLEKFPCALPTLSALLDNFCEEGREQLGKVLKKEW